MERVAFNQGMFPNLITNYGEKLAYFHIEKSKNAIISQVQQGTSMPLVFNFYLTER